MIRTAEMTDYRAIKDMVRQGESDGDLVYRSKKTIKKRIKQGKTLVAEQDGEVVGTISVKTFGREVAEARSLYVKPEARGNGIGTQLVEGLLEQPVRILPSAAIFAITSAPGTFEKAGFTSKQGKQTVLFKKI